MIKTKRLKQGADDLIDWGETNPFGEFGNYTGISDVRNTIL